MKLEFYRQIFGNTQIQNFIKILLVGAELFHEDGGTDRHDEANSDFSRAPETQLHTKTHSSVPFGVIIAVYFEDHPKHECRIYW